MMILLSPNVGGRTCEHERVYIVANKKTLESFNRVDKVCKCVRRIYAAKTVQIRAIVKSRVNNKNKKPSSQKEKEKEKGLEKLPQDPADDENDGQTLLEDNDSETASGLLSSQSRALKTMKRRNITTCLDKLHKLEQRETYTRPVSYMYHAS